MPLARHPGTTGTQFTPMPASWRAARHAHGLQRTGATEHAAQPHGGAGAEHAAQDGRAGGRRALEVDLPDGFEQGQAGPPQATVMRAG
jgi:hypothetical protein